MRSVTKAPLQDLGMRRREKGSWQRKRLNVWKLKKGAWKVNVSGIWEC